MPEQQPINDEPAAVGDAFEQPSRQLTDSGDAAERDAWLEQAEELPPRPRRRVLAPLPLALLAALAIACGFIAGVLVEKGQSGGSTAAAGAGGAFASRLAALRGGTGGGGAGSALPSSSSTGSGSAADAAGTGSPAGSRGLGAAGASATVGQVAYANKGTLYVTTSEGNTVKVTAASGASVTKTVKASIKAIHPGETVIVAGTSSASGAVSASSIRIGSVASAIGGGSGLLGGGSTAGGASSGAGAGGSAGGGEPQLFGKG